MMLRIISQMVDGDLDLRRTLSHQLDHGQAQLLNPRTRFVRWDARLQARAALHQLESLCDDQRTALLNWIESLNSEQATQTSQTRCCAKKARVRSRAKWAEGASQAPR